MRTPYGSGIAGKLADLGFDLIGENVTTRNGTLDVVARRGDLIVFGGDYDRMKVAYRVRAAAVAWMSLNPRAQKGVRRYRFDVMNSDGAYYPNAF